MHARIGCDPIQVLAPKLMGPTSAEVRIESSAPDPGIFLGFGLSALFAHKGIAFLEERWIWPALLLAAGLGIVWLHFAPGANGRERGVIPGWPF